jgi:hypothetical protein
MARTPKKKVVEKVPEDTPLIVKTEMPVNETKEEPTIELIPKFEEVIKEEVKKEALADKNQEKIKQLRKKLETGLITDGEAQMLFRLLSDI